MFQEKTLTMSNTIDREGNVHKGICQHDIKLMEDLEQQHKLIDKEIKQFNQYIEILQGRNKSLVRFVEKKRKNSKPTDESIEN